MKKLLVFAILALGLVACGQKEEAKPAEEATAQVEQAAEQVLTFSREDGEANVVVKTTDNFATATIVVGEQEYAAAQVESADGVKVATEDGNVAVHFKGDEGILEADGTETMLTAVK